MLTRLRMSKLLRYPLLRGMMTYTVLWPTANLVQQRLEGKHFDSFDYKQCVHYGLYGAFYVAPTLYGWVRISSIMWPSMNLKTALFKAAIEQATYGPFAGVSFLYIMSLIEGKTSQEAALEVKNKFPQTYAVGLAVWPIVQTINFAFIHERNRVPFVAACSFLWTVFLASVKRKDSA
ncbi:mpv17-like protein [Anopheles nili]|uniref:mpv17-like protein n=1 Tax=Anopheles nili TaxID=185578 RepID=UPI00237BE7DE|nr:mpv17-like protein [Anopheles nili]